MAEKQTPFKLRFKDQKDQTQFENLVDALDYIIETNMKSQQFVTTQIAELSHIMIGVSGHNGLRQDLKDLKSMLEEFEKRLEKLETWKTRSMALLFFFQLLLLPVLFFYIRTWF